MDKKLLGRFIKKRRKELHITQNEFAELLNVMGGAVSKWETGRSYPDIELLEPIAEILQVPIERLFEEARKEKNKVNIGPVAIIVFLIGILIHRWFAFGTITFEGENVMFMMWMWLFAALRCSVLSAMGFLVSTYVTNYYIAMTMPLLMYYAILQVEHWISVFFPMIPPEFRFSKVYLTPYLWPCVKNIRVPFMVAISLDL